MAPSPPRTPLWCSGATVSTTAWSSGGRSRETSTTQTAAARYWGDWEDWEDGEDWGEWEHWGDWEDWEDWEDSGDKAQLRVLPRPTAKRGDGGDVQQRGVGFGGSRPTAAGSRRPYLVCAVVGLVVEQRGGTDG